MRRPRRAPAVRSIEWKRWHKRQRAAPCRPIGIDRSIWWAWQRKQWIPLKRRLATNYWADRNWSTQGAAMLWFRNPHQHWNV